MLLKHKHDLLFIGLYDTERFEPVSLSGSSSVHIPEGPDDDDPADDWRIQITPKQLRAIYCHIKFGRTLMVGIDIAHLNFACIRNGTSGLSGMSNFNMEPRERKQADKLLFSITHEHYTRQDSLEGVHALNLAALLQDDVLIVGISKSSEVSVSESLKQVILIKDGKLNLDLKHDKLHLENEKSVGLDSDKKEVLSDKAMAEQSAFIFDELDPDSDSTDSDEDRPRTRPRNKPLSELGRVEMRGSTKSEAEKQTDQLKRQTSFCEDWRTATIKSIEALQKARTQRAEQTKNDTEPLLLDDIGVHVDESDRGSAKTDQEVTSWTQETRRSSRATQV